MAGKKRKSKGKENAEEKFSQNREFMQPQENEPDGKGSYGVELLMNESESGSFEPRKPETYHFSSEDLEHKKDRIDR